MPAIHRPLAGQPLRFDLDEERTRTQTDPGLERSGRSARTLVKEEGLRVTLVTLAPGGSIASHHADGPISLQGLGGEVHLHADGATHPLPAGALLTLPAGLPHEVTSEEGGSFLLTVAWAPEAG